MGSKWTARQQGAGEPPMAAHVASPADVEAASAVLLPADCRMVALAALKAELLDALAAGAGVMDGSRVERTDTAALQLLVLFRRELEAQGGTLTWRGTSDALIDAAGLLGLAKILNLPATALA